MTRQVGWPVLLFDDDNYPYVIENSEQLQAWAEGPETIGEFANGFDCAGRRLGLVYVGESWILQVGDVELATLRTLARTSIGAHAGGRLPAARLHRLETMTARELIGLVEELGNL